MSKIAYNGGGCENDKTGLILGVKTCNTRDSRKTKKTKKST